MLLDDIVSQRNRTSNVDNYCNFLFDYRIQREAILENDFASNVKLLQNYPPIDINVVLTHAVSLA